MRDRISARSLMAVMLIAFPLTAEARIEISPPTGPQPLRLSGAQLRDMPNVIVIQEEVTLAAPQPFPGGCFNCGALRLNRENSLFPLGRSQRFSHQLYGSNRQRIFLLPP